MGHDMQLINPTHHISDYAYILKWISEGKQLQKRTDLFNEWNDVEHHHVLRLIADGDHPPDRFRIRAHYIQIGSYDVPLPETQPLGGGQAYYVPDILAGAAKPFNWSGNSNDAYMLQYRLIHLEEKNALIHLRAILSLGIA